MAISSVESLIWHYFVDILMDCCRCCMKHDVVVKLVFILLNHCTGVCQRIVLLPSTPMSISVM